MDRVPRENRELERQLDKLMRIVNESPIKATLSKVQEDLADCRKTLNAQIRSLMLIASSGDQLSMLRKLVAKSNIDDIFSVIDCEASGIMKCKSDIRIHILVKSATGRVTESKVDFQPETSIVVGRHPTKSALVIDRDLTLVSGVHAELRMSANSEISLRDLGSLNGTFVNQVKSDPHQWVDISIEDHISLGGQDGILGSAVLSFSSSRINHGIEHAKQNCSLVVTTVLLLLSNTDSNAATEDVRSVLSTSSASTVIALLNRSSTALGNMDLVSLRSELNKLGPRVFLFCIYLEPYAPEDGMTVMIPEAQPEYESLIIQLRASHEYSLFASSLSRSLSRAADCLREKYVNVVKASYGAESTDATSLRTLPSQMKGVHTGHPLADIYSRYDTLIQELKNSLASRKAELLDDYSPHSLTRSLDQEISSLTRVRERKNDIINISLIPPSFHSGDISLHQYMILYCHSLLSAWSNSLLDSVFDDDGVKDCISRLHKEATQLLNTEPYYHGTSEVSQRPKLYLDINMVLNAEIAPPETFAVIRYPGLLGYIFKNLRGQIMSIGGTIVIVGGMLTQQIRDGLKETVLPALLPLIGVLTWLAYRQDLNHKSEEAIERLKKDLRSYYIVYVKSRLDKVASALLDLLIQDKNSFGSTLPDVVMQPTMAVQESIILDVSNYDMIPPQLTRSAIAKMTRQIEILTKSILDLNVISKD